MPGVSLAARLERRTGVVLTEAALVRLVDRRSLQSLRRRRPDLARVYDWNQNRRSRRRQRDGALARRRRPLRDAPIEGVFEGVWAAAGCGGLRGGLRRVRGRRGAAAPCEGSQRRSQPCRERLAAEEEVGDDGDGRQQREQRREYSGTCAPSFAPAAPSRRGPRARGRAPLAARGRRRRRLRRLRRLRLSARPGSEHGAGKSRSAAEREGRAFGSPPAARSGAAA